MINPADAPRTGQAFDDVNLTGNPNVVGMHLQPRPRPESAVRHLNVVLLLMLVVMQARAQSHTSSLDAGFLEGEWVGTGDGDTRCWLTLVKDGTGVLKAQTSTGGRVHVGIQKWVAKKNVLLVVSSDKPVVAAERVDGAFLLQGAGVACRMVKKPHLPEETRPAAGPSGLMEVGSTQGVPPGVQEKVDRALRARTGGFTGCYNNALRRDAGLRGTMRIGFSVDAEGRMLDAQVREDELLDQELGQCITTLVKRIRLPRMGSEMVSASVPLVFRGVAQP